MFIFASFGLQIAGGKLARCSDKNITNPVNVSLTNEVQTLLQEDCVGRHWQKIMVTRLQVPGRGDNNMHPGMYVPRVW